jgi:ubiquinol-cytochrome c reductase iron-sulfur subunit
VWILRRTPEMLAALKKTDAEVADPKSERKAYPTPEYARNEYRSIKPEYFVAVGICTHLGCSPSDKLAPGPQASLPDDWQAASCAPATGPPSTWPAASTRTSPRRTTSRFRRTSSCPTRAC